MTMPNLLDLGSHMASAVGSPIHHFQSAEEYPNPCGYRHVMGYFLPTWQRGIVWDESRQIKLIESLWVGIPVGTFTFNRSKVYGGPLDNLLIDGQQRMHSLERYLTDSFPVFGRLWSGVSVVDKRMFAMSRQFHCYITNSEDEDYLRGYYDLMNFGGVAHTEDQRATPSDKIAALAAYEAMK